MPVSMDRATRNPRSFAVMDTSVISTWGIGLVPVEPPVFAAPVRLTGRFACWPSAAFGFNFFGGMIAMLTMVYRLRWCKFRGFGLRLLRDVGSEPHEVDAGRD